MKNQNQIVFYDGECGLCQRSISIISRWDSKKLLFFAPLNGQTYKKYFNETNDMTTVVYFVNGKIFTKSDAIIEIGKTLGGLKKLLFVLKIIPHFIRDAVYNFIAGNRNNVSCIILTKDERFLN
ncbi:MAG: DUF393 domain-containing protein [Bacteriovorax sp.]|nr:DUF393 domain-containing protein [Bacteriovorax sp.]